MNLEEKVARYEMALEVIANMLDPYPNCKEFRECKSVASKALKVKETETYKERVRSPL